MPSSMSPASASQEQLNFKLEILALVKPSAVEP
jgi:hypothetical protein